MLFIFTNNNLSGRDISGLIDSIEQQNLYAHDTVKIRNYIKIYELLNETNIDTSLYFIEKAIKIDSLSSEMNFLPRLLLIKGHILQRMHLYTEALMNFEKSLSIASNQNDNNFIAEIYNSIGLLYVDMNRIEEAFSIFLDALKLINKKTTPQLYSTVLNSLGYSLQIQKKYRKALKYFKQSFEIYKSINEKMGMAHALNNIGGMYFYLDKKDSVLYYFNKAVELYGELNDIKSQAFPIFNIGETYYEMEQYNKAIEYILKSYEIEKKFNDKKGMAIALNFLGKIYSKKGFFKYGLELYNQAMEICDEINEKYELEKIYYNISENYEKLGQHNEALKFYKLYSEIKDTLFNIESANKIVELETRYKTEQQQSEIEIQRIKLENQENEIKQQWLQKIAILIGFILLAIFFLVIYRNYHLKNRSNELLMKQKAQIESQNNKITSSIQYAKLIQTAALPPHDLLKSIFSQHFVLYLPRDIVSGDFFWATHKEGYSVIACADCTGHGVPGAFMSMLGVSFLTEIVNRSIKLKADELLENLRQNIIESLHQTGRIGESRDGMDIAICIINRERTQLEYAGAFIPLVVIRDNNIIQISGDKMPIGLHDENMLSFTSHKVKLMKNDMVYLFSDGYADQFGGPFNKKFKMQPFLSLLLAQHSKPLVQQREILYDTIMSWRGEIEQIDDILVMGFRV